MTDDPAVNYLLENIEAVLRILAEHDSSPTRAWKQLVKELPEIKEVMNDRAFRSYWKFLPVISSLQHNLHQINWELSNIRQKQETRTSAQEQTSLFAGELGNRLDKGAVNIAGWTVRQRPNGFYYLYKTIKKKTRCIYLGKTLDRVKAEKKISAFEAKLGNN